MAAGARDRRAPDSLTHCCGSVIFWKPSPAVACGLSLSREWLEEIAQIYYEIANIDGFGVSGRCSNVR